MEVRGLKMADYTREIARAIDRLASEVHQINRRLGSISKSLSDNAEKEPRIAVNTEEVKKFFEESKGDVDGESKDD